MPRQAGSRSARVEASIPTNAGVGLKPAHYRTILEKRPQVGWFEVHPENYMGEGGPPHRYLEAIRELYPISLHGVGLSIGGEQPLDAHHLERLAALVRRYQPGLFSEHLAWSTHATGFLNDLLPLSYNEETLAHVVAHVSQTHDYLGVRILLENPSTYVRFSDSYISEPQFLGEVADRTGCGLLLDVNNVHVSAVNHGFDAGAYIDHFPMQHVAEIHVAGHLHQRGDLGEPLLIDSHDRPVQRAVWALLEQTLERTGPLPVLIEWDAHIPDWALLFEQAQQAERIIHRIIHNWNGPHAVAS
ncbi:MAG: DUF692 family multinuclear iron-containing protein [Gammaproteobacteria bacterium]